MAPCHAVLAFSFYFFLELRTTCFFSIMLSYTCILDLNYCGRIWRNNTSLLMLVDLMPLRGDLTFRKKVQKRRDSAALPCSRTPSISG